MSSTRQKKAESVILKELADIFQRGIITSNGAFVTITHIRITPDLRNAKVYLSIFSSADKEAVLKKIKEQSGEIRGNLGKRMKHQLRSIPHLTYFIDDSLDYEEKIDRLLKM